MVSSTLALVALSICTPWAWSQESGNLGGEAQKPLEDSPEELRKWLGERIDQLVTSHRGLSNAKIGIHVVDLDSDEVLYTRATDVGFNVASNTKLATAAAALSLLGPDHRFRTTLAAEEVDERGVIPGDLYIRSLADPSLTTWDLHELAEDLSIRGISEVRGGIIVDDSYFDTEYLPPHFTENPPEDDHATFRAPISATSLNFNTVSLLIIPTQPNKAARVLVEPKNRYVKVKGQIMTVRSGRTRLRIEPAPNPGALEIEISGQIRAEVRHRRFRLRVPDPVSYIGSAFREHLVDRGIRVRKKTIRRGKVPDQAQLLATRQSPPLAELVRGLGKYSNNYVAEMLLKTVGAESLGSEERPATWDDGLAAVRHYLASDIGLSGTFYYGNGSGLYGASSFSPRQIVQIVTAAHRDFRIAPDFLSSLAISSADGTLRKRMIDSPAERIVRAKTGTLESASALSGIVAVDGRRPVAFSVLVNDVPKWRIGDARSLQDGVAAAIAQLLNRQQ